MCAARGSNFKTQATKLGGRRTYMLAVGNDHLLGTANVRLG